MGSARVPRASSGVAPELPSHTLAGISRSEKFTGRCFRHDAENLTPEACAPRNTPWRPFSTSEFGLNGFSFPVRAAAQSLSLFAVGQLESARAPQVINGRINLQNTDGGGN